MYIYIYICINVYAHKYLILQSQPVLNDNRPGKSNTLHVVRRDKGCVFARPFKEYKTTGIKLILTDSEES